MTGADNRNAGADSLESEAVAWIRRLTSGQATAADAEALKLWCNQSPAHAAAFSTASRLWKDLKPAGRNLRQRDAAVSARAGVRQSYPSVNRRFLLGGGLAAASAAAVYAVVHPPLGLWPSWMELRADYRTGTGEQRDVMLSDAVSIRMNTQTSIALQRSDPDTERVELIGGEASFSTSLSGGRSLAVLAADGWVTANAAQFEVRHLGGRTASSICVTCLQGEIEIERGSEKTTLTSRQQLRYDSAGLARLEAIDPDVASAWQRGILVFRFTPLAEVVEEVNRYRLGRIVVVNPETGRIPVSGRFRIDNLDEILTRIEQAFGATVRSFPGGLVLLS